MSQKTKAYSGFDPIVMDGVHSIHTHPEFKRNKYTAWYISIIESAICTPRTDGYYETHHIIPVCVGGTNHISNLVNLSAREHFICHLLLTKASDNHKLKFAFVAMSRVNPNQVGNRVSIKSHTYEYMKKCNSEAASIRSLGKANHNIGKRMYHNPTTGEERLSLNPIDGWILGSPKRSGAMMGVYKNKTFYYNPTDGTVIRIDPAASPPTGYVKGKPQIPAAVLERRRGVKTYKDVVTGKTTRTKVRPDGYVEGSAWRWITDGTQSCHINVERGDMLPVGWRFGRVNTQAYATRKASNSKPVRTPLGEYTHPLRFCEEYGCDISLFSNLDNRLKITKRLVVLKGALEKVGYDFSKTKRENGFYFKEQL